MVLLNKDSALSTFGVIFTFLSFTSCINEVAKKKDDRNVCIELNANDNYEKLLEFNKKFVGKETYDNYLAIVKDSIRTWSNISDTSIYRYWGYSPILIFNAKKTCFFITTYYAYKIHPDTIKNTMKNGKLMMNKLQGVNILLKTIWVQKSLLILNPLNI
ncbi:MAG: hypothetical protein BGO87_09290 [Flavobacteriia bacterium 40-80]|nr:MAG: hypothetical protein BGO87_09290 [Flavobacteriia bacterium 40-80]